MVPEGLLMNISQTFGWIAAVSLLGSGAAAGHGEAKPDVLIAWNQRVLAIAEAEDGFLSLKGVRTAAMMHIAMHDAVNASSRRFAPYAYDARATGEDPVAAAAQAPTKLRSRNIRTRLPGSRRSSAAGSGKFLTTLHGRRESQPALRQPRRYSSAAAATAGIGRPNTAGTRWRRVSTRSSTSTAGRRKVSFSAPAGQVCGHS